MLCKTESTRCSAVTVTAKDSSDSAANDIAGGVDIYRPPADRKAAITLAWSDRRFNGRELWLGSYPSKGRPGSICIIPQYFPTDLQLIIAALLARCDTKVSPIPSSNCFAFRVLVLSPRRIRSHRARPVGALQKGPCCTDQSPGQDEVVLRGNRAHRVCFGLLGI